MRSDRSRQNSSSAFAADHTFAMKPIRTSTSGRTGRPRTIDEYLARLNVNQRAALAKIRDAIRSAAPKAEECISYQLAAFRFNGMLVAFGATANHCAFYPMSGSTIEQFADDLKGFETSKGTIRFQPEKPLPAALVRKLVKARLAENRLKSVANLS